MADNQFDPNEAAPPPQRPKRPGPSIEPGAVPRQPAYPYEDVPPQAIEQNSDARTWGMLCHLAQFSGYVVPFGNVIGPLVCWMIKKEEYPFVDDQGKESLNFQLTVLIATLAVAAIGLVTSCIVIGYFILLIGIPAILIADLVLTIMAALQANQGQYYRYPLNIRMIR